MTRTATVAAMANAHSHAFQIDLRGRAERFGRHDDDFWSWREGMYALAAALDPDSMHEVGRRAYREMVRAGYGLVGEFHYVHHQPDGTPYADPNALAKALAAAAQAEGLSIVLLPAAYHRAGWDGSDLPPSPGQLRFCDPDVVAFLARVEQLRVWAVGQPGVSVGVAAHSVRAVPAAWLEAIAAYSDQHSLVRHVHAHEQPRELDECQAEHGCTPIELLSRYGFLGPRASVVHGVHVSQRDIELLAGSGTTVVSCPLTEGNLGDGVFPALEHHAAGVPIAIGSDSQVVIDPFEEARELETLARRSSGRRHALLAAVGDLWAALAADGARSLGVDGIGTIEIDLDHPRLEGVQEADLGAALVTCAGAEVVATPAVAQL